MGERGARFEFTTAILSCALACAACSADAPHTAPVRAAESSPPRLELLGREADVWAFRVRVRGAIRGSGDPTRCHVQSDARSVPARIDGRTFDAEVELAEGENVVRASCIFGRTMVRSAAIRYHVRLPDLPKARAELEDRQERLWFSGRKSEVSPRARAPIVAYRWFHGVARGRREPIGEGPELSVPVPDRDGRYEYELEVMDARGRVDSARLVVAVRAGRVTTDSHWLDEAVFYGVVPPFFGRPPLVSVERAIRGLAELGVTALWLSPTFAAPPGDFGYAVTNYFDVRPDYGTPADMRALIRSAHAAGLRVLLDMVPNHVSRAHRYFVDAETWGPESHYFEFFVRDDRKKHVYYFDWEHLPNLNYENPEVRNWLTAAGAFWIRDFDVDGYRVDAAWGVRERRPSFWRDWAAEIRRVEPQAVLLAEASARDRFYLRNGFDGAYDWTDELGHWAWEYVFDEPTGVARRLNEALLATERASANPARVLRFLNNNDTGPRFIAKYGAGMARVATALLLTLPGIPCLYTFDELGADFLPYSGLRPLEPPSNPQLRDWHRALIALRRGRAALRGVHWVPLWVGERDEAYVYLRASERPGEAAIVALNFAGEKSHPSITIPERYSALRRVRWRSALPGVKGSLRGPTLRFELEAWGVRIFVPEPPPQVDKLKKP